MKTKVTLLLIVALVASITAIAVLYTNLTGKQTAAQNITVGSYAPNYNFFLANGTLRNLSEFRGNITVLWFVATWCPSCAQGNAAINQKYQFFKQRGIKIVELELYRNLGYNGPPIASFVNSYAYNAYSNGTIIPALAGYNMTAAYDPNGYLDIYYVVSGKGRVLYISGSPADTLGQLIHAVNESV